MAAIRQLGGRFLELDERSGLYNDIGDKKATEKTSQALREGQTKIRKDMYNNEMQSGGDTTAFDASLLASTPAAGVSAPVIGNGREISAEGYLGYSAQVLESLYKEEEEGAAPAKTKAQAKKPDPPAARQPVPAQPSPVMSHIDAQRRASLEMAMAQFPGAITSMPSLPQVQQMDHSRPSLGRFTNDMSVGRLTDFSISSVFSLTQLLESARDQEILDLIRSSAMELQQVEHSVRTGLSVDEAAAAMMRKAGTSADRAAMDITVKDDDMKEDRVSELRMTDVSECGGKGGYDVNPRHTDTTESTRNSLMDASIMSIGTADMSMISSKERSTMSNNDDNKDRETADLLLGFSKGDR